MKVILNNEFATAEDTAAVLGVSKKRLKWLMKLVEPKVRSANYAYSVQGKSAGNGSIKRATARRRKQTRAKTKKAAH
jgi:hypothetical protein